jgi:hypothetical protein
MRGKAILLAMMGIVLMVGTGVSLAAVLVGDPTGIGSDLAANRGPTVDRSVSPGGRDDAARSSAYRLASHSEELPEEDISYDHEDEELLQADDEDRYHPGEGWESADEQDDGEIED